MSDRLRRLRPASEQPDPLELGGGRARALPPSAAHFVEQRGRGALWRGAGPARPASGQEQEVRPPPAPTFPRCQAGSRKPQGRDGAERVTPGEQRQRAAELGERVVRHPLQQGDHRRAVDGVALVSGVRPRGERSEEHTSELQSLAYLVCRLLLEKKKERVAGCVLRNESG